MKKCLGLVLLVGAVAFLMVMWGRREGVMWRTVKDPESVRVLKRFEAVKEAQARAATNGMPPEVGDLFAAAKRGDFGALTNGVRKVGIRNGSMQEQPVEHGKVMTAVGEFLWDIEGKIGWYRLSARWREAEVEARERDAERLRGTPWEAIKEVKGVDEAFMAGDEKYDLAFGREIIDSIPAGSIYLGGWGRGRFIVMAMSQAQPDGEPFFTVAQDEINYHGYAAQLRSMYGGKIRLPDDDDTKRIEADYLAEATKPDAKGNYPYVDLGWFMTKDVFERNRDRQFYVCEDYPQEWMYTNLEPHGLVMKLDREPVKSLSEEVVKRDSDFWRQVLAPKIGGWLWDGTSLEEIVTFADTVFGRDDLSGFHGDPRFVHNRQAW